MAAVVSPIIGPEGGFVLNLVGELGAGKTHFVKGLAAGLGIEADQVTSPTFAIVNEYDSRGRVGLIHLDFYRLESEMAPADLLALTGGRLAPLAR